MLRVSQLLLSLDDDKSVLERKLIKKLHIQPSQLCSYRIYKEAVDARYHPVRLSYIVDCEVKNEASILKKKLKDVTFCEPIVYHYPQKGNQKLKHRIVVVGFGPAGMFAGLLLAQMGYRPYIIERGGDIETRSKDVEAFWQQGCLNPESNVSFGEGGAGAFSDGKLTARSKDPRVRRVLEELCRLGAPEEILYEAHPHIGTDLLCGIVKKIREEIIAYGGEVHFHSRMNDIRYENGKITALLVNDEWIDCDACIMAIGHSARDTYRMLLPHLEMKPKAFAVGVRVEHKQEWIAQAQYKESAHHPKLKQAEYRLTTALSSQRGAHTFCMCPGGYVVASASSKGKLVVNGMSMHARNGENANAALLVQVKEEDYGNTIEGGLSFQEQMEEAAYQVSGSYLAPCQRVEDFLLNRPSTNCGVVKPTYPLGVVYTNLHDVLPSFVAKGLQEAIVNLGKKLKRYDDPDALLTGVETRSSAPLRIVRDHVTLQSLSLQSLYPCGEGAGYAGGIVSAAIDGIRCAEAIIQNYQP